MFALPFAYVGAFLAVDGWPGLANVVWVTVAMVGARTLAMSLNRLVDAELDARNPRTAIARAPGGRAHARTGARACACCRSRVFLVAVSQLDPIVRWLWPIPVAMFVVYPYLKRVTWLCHLWLGACLGLAPVGAWLAVTGTAPWEAWAIGARRAALGRRLRPLLLALRPRARPRGGAPLVGRALRRARSLHRRARASTPGRSRLLAAGGRRARRVGSSTGSASSRRRRCSPTSTRSCVPATSAGSTPRSSR